MRIRSKGLTVALALVLSVSGLVFSQSQGARWRVETAVYYITNGWIAEAMELLQQAAHMSPHYAEAQLWLALVLHSLGDVEGALAAYERLLELAPETAPYGVLVGDIHFAAGRLDEARAAYEQALAMFPDAGLAHYGLARVMEARGDAGAVNELRAAVENAPDFVDARLRLGRLLRLQGQLEEALEHLLYASRIDGRHAAVRLELALVYEALDRTAEAENEFRVVLRLDPNNEEASRGLQRLREAVQANT